MKYNKVLRALKRDTCRQIIEVLRTGPKSVGEITTIIGFGVRTNTSQALSLLLDAQIVSMQTAGRIHYYELLVPALQEFSDYLYGLVRDARQLQKAAIGAPESR